MFVVLVAGSAAVSPFAASGAAACSGPLVTVGEAQQMAPTIALVRTAVVLGPPAFPEGYDFIIEETFRGKLDASIRVQAPQWHACGDRISATVGDRFVIAFDVPAFVGQPAMNPYWRVAADGTLSPEGIDASAVGWSTVAELRAGLGGGDGSVAVLEREEPGGPSDLPMALALLAALGAIGIGVFGGLLLVARRQRH